MSAITKWIDRTFYPKFARNWDDDRFRTEILKHLGRDSRCLDFGAGRGNVQQMDFSKDAAFVAGVDVDEAVLSNPYLHDARVLLEPRYAIPFPDDSFDVVFSDNVFEHVATPAEALQEIKRVLRPGGILLVKTPNRWHYVATMARLTPLWFHRFFNKRRGRQTHDTFPTLYRCNSRRQVRRLAKSTGLECVIAETWEGRPEYLRGSALLYFPGLVYERIVNMSDWLAGFRCVLCFCLRKP